MSEEIRERYKPMYYTDLSEGGFSNQYAYYDTKENVHIFGGCEGCYDDAIGKRYKMTDR